MMRRYESKLVRFAQPDPSDGSYNLSDPQSFNRYAYVQNDPVNFVDPRGLCNFNININDTTGMNKEQLAMFKSEISRIFEAAGQKVFFGQPNMASNSRTSYTINVNRTFSSGALAVFGATGNDPNRALGITAYKDGEWLNYGWLSTNAIEGYTGNKSSLGRARVAAHEAGHYFLGRGHGDTGFPDTGLMANEADFDLDDADSSSNYTFTKEEAARLSDLCPPPLPDVLPTAGGDRYRGPRREYYLWDSGYYPYTG